MDLLDAPASEWLPTGIDPGQLRVYSAVPDQVRDARRFAVKWLHLIEQPVLIDRVQEVVSELATNAVRHASPQGVNDRFAVRLTLVRGVARVDVMDHSPDMPVVHSVDDLDVTDESGRGMLLVDALSDEWIYKVRKVGDRVVKVVRAAFFVENSF